MYTQLLTDWINSTKQHNNSEKENYYNFIQLYFLLNHTFKEMRNNARDSDTNTMTKAFPEIINAKWGSINSKQSIKNDIKTIHFLMMKLIDFLISNRFSSIKDKNFLFTELIPIGYYYNVGSYYTVHITKNELIQYNTIIKFREIKQEETVKFFEATLTILYAIRNSYYHGQKLAHAKQDDLLLYLNYIMIEILKISRSIQSDLYSTNIEREINDIEKSYKQKLAIQLKTDLCNGIRSSEDDFEEWRKLSESGNDYFYFAYSFIIIEKIHKIIIRVLHNTNDDIIDAIKKIETHFDIQFKDNFPKDISKYRKEYEHLKLKRNAFFHGNNDTQLDIGEIQNLNSRLDEFITQIKMRLDYVLYYFDHLDFS